MTHRERLLTALDHREPDHVPLDLASTVTTGITARAYGALARHLGFDPQAPVIDRIQQLAQPSSEVLDRLDIDTRPLYCGAPDCVRDEEIGDGLWKDEWGVVRKLANSGLYYDLQSWPFTGDEALRDLEAFPWPDPDDPGRVRGMREQARELHEHTDYAVVLNLPVAFITQTQFSLGFENWFMKLVQEPEYLGRLCDLALDSMLRVAQHVFDEVDDHFDVIWIGDDISGQNGPMQSLRHYREVLKPRQRRILDFIRQHSGAKVLYHGCGSMTPFLDDLIEMGVSAFNPVQVSAVDMDSAMLKKRFGDRLSFWGGIDTQHVLPTGSPEDVRAEVKRRIDDLAPGGGYVVHSVHNLQADVPPENIVAMFDYAREYSAEFYAKRKT